MWLFRRKAPQAERVPLNQKPWEPDRSGLEAILSDKEHVSEELREKLFENDQLRETIGKDQEEENSLVEYLAQLESEVLQHEENEEAAAMRRQERVATLRRLSQSKTQEVSDLRRKSVVQDAQLAELRRKVAEATASHKELQDCESEACNARGAELRAHRAWVDAETERNVAASSLEQQQEKYIQYDKEVMELTGEFQEAEAQALRDETCYWEDATFLRASEDVVVGFEQQIRDNNEACAEMEEQIRKHRALEDAALQGECVATTSGDEKISATLINGLLQMEEDAQSSKVAIGSRSRSPVRSARTSPQCSPRMLLERTPLSAPSRSSAVQAALATLHSENDRLRQKVDEMRKETEARRSCVQDDAQLDDGSFEAAVAGTGARVVQQMKQALHERVDELRNLHQKKQELDRERRRERRMRADLERRLASMSTSLSEERRNSDSRKDFAGGSVFHSL